MNFKIIIIEDEQLAVQRLKRLLQELPDDSFEIAAVLSSVKDSLAWFNDHDYSDIDFMFSDIQLTDGVSFEIFEKVQITFPIVFTTAFDEYLLQAFKTNGIEYLLKPFTAKDVEQAVSKFKMIVRQKEAPIQSKLSLKELYYQLQNNNYPTFITYSKDTIIPIKSETIVYFILSCQIVSAYGEQRKWVLSESLNQIEEKLPAHHFYRANRQIIINRKFIDRIENYFGGRLLIKMKCNQKDDIIVSKDNCKSFKDWLQE
jgi:two-component system response regulator LytT